MKSFALLLGSAALCSGTTHHHNKGGASFTGEAITTFDFTCPANFTLSVDEAGLEVCTSVVGIPASTRCPSGYRKVGLAGSVTCHSVQSAAPVATCPPNYIRKQNECVLSNASELEQFCPPGFDITTDNSCIKTESVSFQNVCPAGSIPDASGTCVGREITSPDLQCPTGFNQTVRGCEQVNIVASELVCPINFELNGTSCVRLEVTTPTPSCPTGSSLEDGQCTTTQTAPTSFECPTGFEGPDAFNTCTERVVEAPEPFCPDNSTLVAGQCERIEISSFLPFCQTGELINGECQLEITSAPVLTCPSGFTLQGNIGQAELEVASKRSRRHQHKKKMAYPEVEAVCAATEEIDVDFFCPVGFLDNGDDCIATSTTPSVETCPVGSSRIGTECVTLETAAPTLECGPDLTLNAVTNRCESIDFADIIFECPSGYVLSQLQSPAGGQLCEKCNPTVKAVAACEYKPALHVCPTGFVKNESKECSRINAVLPTQVCPDGFLAVSNDTPATASVSKWDKRHDKKEKEQVITNELPSVTCTLREVVVAEATCPPGVTQDGDLCVTTTSVPKIQRCPEGFSEQRISSKHAHGHHDTSILDSCSRIITNAVVRTCPDGFELAASVGELLEDGSNGDICVAQEVSATENRCPAGFTSGTVECERTIVSPARVRCPPEFVLATTSECAQTITEAATPVCPEFFVLEGSVCVFTANNEIDETCPTGFEEVNGGCERETVIPAVLRCPPSYRLQNDECVQLNSAEVEEVCPTGFTLERQVAAHHAHRHHQKVSSVCVNQLTSEAEPTCPPLYFTAPDGLGCLRETVVSPGSRCAAGTKLKHGKCVSSDNVTPTVACPEGFVMERSTIRGAHGHHNKLGGMQCILEDEIATELFCSDGSLPVDGLCTVERQVPALRVANTIIETTDQAADELTFIKPVHHQKKK